MAPFTQAMFCSERDKTATFLCVRLDRSPSCNRAKLTSERLDSVPAHILYDIKLPKTIVPFLACTLQLPHHNQALI